MTLVVFENSKTCGYCKRLETVLKSAAVVKWLMSIGASLVRADAGTDMKNYATLKKQFGFSGAYPRVYVVDNNGKKVGNFLARNATAASIKAKVDAVCPECCDGDNCADKPVVSKVCPTCKGSGKVLALLVVALSLACGCVWTGGSYKTADGTEVTGRRAAFLYPFKLGNTELIAPASAGSTAGKFAITGYETDGGAGGVVAIMDSAGNIIGAMATKAAKTAVTVP